MKLTDFLYEAFISHTNCTINLEIKVKGKVCEVYKENNILGAVGFEMELDGGRVICLGRRQRDSCDEMGHMARAHPTVVEDTQ